ncbi:MAG: hypothetical protein LT106_18650 [Burkholderiaceae bacterium]|nr:hypothetical protein [Burkholderiaceae bacterium]
MNCVASSLDFLPADLARTIERLENWGRWARERGRKSRARSIEGRYRPRRGSIDVESRAAPLEVDVFDASLVDRCLASAGGFPMRWSRLLKAHFVWQADRYATGRRLAIPVREYANELHRAVCGARNALTRRGA